MRHRKIGNKLNRTTSHRKATLSNLSSALIEHKRIMTTKAKAKETRKVVEKLITFAKKGTLASRRQVLKTIPDKKLVQELFNEIASHFSERDGGYTRIIKLGRRQGDGASLAYIELVGFEGVHIEKSKAKEKAKQKAKEKGKAKEKEPETVAE